MEILDLIEGLEGIAEGACEIRQGICRSVDAIGSNFVEISANNIRPRGLFCWYRRWRPS